jgi:hypothetical protein
VAIESSTRGRPLVSVAIDSVADASLVAQRAQREAEDEALACHACDAPMEGVPAGRGLFMWVRGEEVRFEEPALCAQCATAIGITALAGWTVEEEEG